MFNLYARATGWLSAPHVERRVALLAFVCALPSLAMGLYADDYVLQRNLRDRGPTEAYSFFSRDPRAAAAQLIEERNTRGLPWWADEHPRTSFFRPLSSLSLWLDFTSGAPRWWMHLENCVMYAAMVWLAVALYRQLGLSDSALGWSALFFGLDGAIATSVGWIAGRNTLLAACFGLACMLVHDRARRTGRPVLLLLSCVCFVLALMSAELGLCTLGYLTAHALAIDRESPRRRVLALLPYGVVTGAYLANYVIGGYGASGGSMYRDIAGAPIAAALGFVESLPVWLATTATLPIASFQLLITDFRIPLLVFSFAALALIVPLLGWRSTATPHGRMFAIGSLLCLVPLASVMPQERLRFFASFGVFGLLGPWVARDFEAAERMRRLIARFVWRLHGVWLPLLFVPCLFSIANGPGVDGAIALDRALPRANAPIAILLNPPVWIAPWLQVAKRASNNEVGPPVYALYAGGQALEVRRVDDRSLELRVARSWFETPFEKSLRNVSHAPFHAGDHIDLTHLAVDVREVDSEGAPTLVRFTFERSLDDPALSFRSWKGSDVALWKPPPVGIQLQLTAAKTL